MTDLNIYMLLVFYELEAESLYHDLQDNKYCFLLDLYAIGLSSC